MDLDVNHKGGNMTNRIIYGPSSLDELQERWRYSFDPGGFSHLLDLLRVHLDALVEWKEGSKFYDHIESPLLLEVVVRRLRELADVQRELADHFQESVTANALLAEKATRQGRAQREPQAQKSTDTSLP